MRKYLLLSLVLLVAAALIVGLPTVARAACTVVSNPTAMNFTNCPNENLDSADFSGGTDLSFANFSGANLNNADMSDMIGNDINLSGAILTGADLSASSMIRGNLSNANLTNADLIDANLSKANLSGVTWSNTLCPDGADSNTVGGTCIGHLLLPGITASAQANGAGYSAGTWTNKNVTVHFVCTAATGHTLATCTADQSYTADGSFTANGTATDTAGFFSETSFGPIQIDKVAPAITASAAKADATPYTAGTWTNQNVTVSFTCADNQNGSGLATNTVAGATVSGEGANQAVTNSGACVDKAGNTAAAATFSQIDIDKSAPETTITVQPEDPSPLVATFEFSGTDALSGLASFACSLDGALFTTCTSPQLYSSLAEGQHTFQVQAIDALGHVDATPASYAWTASGDLPVADNQTVTTAEESTVAITLTASSSHVLTYTVVSLPAYGTLSGTPPTLVYTPAVNFTGADSFTFRANDGQFNSNLATVMITVSGVNDTPVAVSQTVTTMLDTSVAVTLTGSDVDNDPLIYAVVDSPEHGTLSGAAPNLVYTPADKFIGNDQFTFQVNDGQVTSNVADVKISVTNPPFVSYLSLLKR